MPYRHGTAARIEIGARALTTAAHAPCRIVFSDARESSSSR